jgi:hypothetical protein
MKVDFWNNPLVVSAFRVKYRRGGVFNLTTIYLLLLVAGGAVLQYYNHLFGGLWQRNYLMALLGLQFFVSALAASTATGSSMRAEVLERTLDFQRIATLTPKQLLLGKLLGEPAIAYLLAIATIPLAAFCWIAGVPGLSLGVLILLYVSLATSTILFGTLGLMQPVELPASKSAASGGGNWGWMLLVLALILAPASQSLLSSPGSAALTGVLTPIPALVGLFHANPWEYCLSMYGLQIPFLLVTPVLQLALAFLLFQVMARRILNPLNTSLGKPTAYAVLLGVDSLVAGVLAEPTPLGMPIVRRCAVFCLSHLVLSYLLLGSITPSRDALSSWVWRFRGRSPWLRGLWLGDRTENGLALVTFCLMGGAGLCLFVLWPAAALEGSATVMAERVEVGSMLVVTALLVLSLGTVYQWFVSVAGRAGRGAFSTLVAILNAPFHIVGQYYHNDFLLALTPSAHFAAWLGGWPSPRLVPLVIVYTLILVVTGALLRQRIRQAERVVDRKLEMMGVVSPSA